MISIGGRGTWSAENPARVCPHSEELANGLIMRWIAAVTSITQPAQSMEHVVNLICFLPLADRNCGRPFQTFPRKGGF